MAAALAVQAPVQRAGQQQQRRAAPPAGPVCSLRSSHGHAFTARCAGMGRAAAGGGAGRAAAQTALAGAMPWLCRPRPGFEAMGWTCVLSCCASCAAGPPAAWRRSGGSSGRCAAPTRRPRRWAAAGWTCRRASRRRQRRRWAQGCVRLPQGVCAGSPLMLMFAQAGSAAAVAALLPRPFRGSAWAASAFSAAASAC